MKNDKGFIFTVDAKSAQDGGDDLNAKKFHDLIFASKFLQSVDEEKAFVPLCRMILEINHVIINYNCNKRFS